MDAALLERLLEHTRSRYYGKYRGTATALDDPEKLGRVRVRVPAVLGDAELWALPCVPYAGKDVGVWLPPPVGASVWVEFEGGDPSRPIWVGCFWAKGELPADFAPDVRGVRTEEGELRFDDAAAEVRLERQGGASLVLATSAETSAGGGKVVVDTAEVTTSAGSGEVRVGAGVNVNHGALVVS